MSYFKSKLKPYWNMAQKKHATYEILKNSILSRPRMMGTPGEEETTQFITEFLTKCDMAPFTEEIEWSTASVKGRKLMFLIMGVFVCLINLFVRFTPPFNGIFSLILIPISIGSLVFFGKALKNDKMNFLGKQAKGKNVICEINPPAKSENSTIIYFTAHSDSIASNMPKFYIKFIIGMLLGFLLIIALTIATSIISLIIHYKSQSVITIICFAASYNNIILSKQLYASGKNSGKYNHLYSTW